MAHGGITYADFGIGEYTRNYAGWTFVGSSDFSGTAEFDAAFAYLYDRNGGLTNLQPGFVSTNCCIIDTTDNSWYGIDGDIYMYPFMYGSIACNPSGGYTAAIVQLSSYSGSEILPTLTASQVGAVSTSTSCSINSNPAIFVQKY
jgi:hypothetical protein